MKARVDEEMVRYLWALRPVPAEQGAPVRQPQRRATPITLNEPAAEPVGAFAAAPRASALPQGGAARQPARTGGDEFVVLASELERVTDAAHIAEKISDMVSVPLPVDGVLEKTGCSIGISIYPDD